MKKDKAEHFIVSMAIFFVMAHLWAIIPAMLIALLAGVIKEIYDRSQQGNYWDWHDLLAGFLGILTGFIIYKWR